MTLINVARVVNTAGITEPGWHVLQCHPPARCRGRGQVGEPTNVPCSIHSPSDHHMRGWPMIWRGDRNIMERECPHGVTHPDPDDVAYRLHLGRRPDTTHGCDGCCQVPLAERGAD